MRNIYKITITLADGSQHDFNFLDAGPRNAFARKLRARADVTGIDLPRSVQTYANSRDAMADLDALAPPPPPASAEAEGEQ